MLDKAGGQTKSQPQPQPGWLRKEAVRLESWLVSWAWEAAGWKAAQGGGDKRCRSTADGIICAGKRRRNKELFYGCARLQRPTPELDLAADLVEVRRGR
jgi:hypothetical protein